MYAYLLCDRRSNVSCFWFSFSSLGLLQEKFIEQLCEDAYALAVARDRKRTFKYDHLCELLSPFHLNSSSCKKN